MRPQEETYQTTRTKLKVQNLGGKISNNKRTVWFKLLNIEQHPWLQTPLFTRNHVYVHCIPQ